MNIYFQDSASSQIEALIELCSNIEFLFAFIAILGLVLGIVCSMTDSEVKQDLGVGSDLDSVSKSKDKQNKSVVLDCSNTFFDMGNMLVPSLFIYDRNDPTGDSLKGLFFIYHFERRRPQTGKIAHYGYIILNCGVQERYKNILYKHEGAEVAINETRHKELVSTRPVYNGMQGLPLQLHHVKGNKSRAYLKSFSTSAYYV